MPLSTFLKRSLAPLPPAQPLKTSRTAVFWLVLSLVFAVYYGILGLQQAFQPGLVVQDDARSYVFWMYRWFDPTLFPHDLIADYFRSIAPPGYVALYHGMALVGIEPLLFSKLLPIVLGAVASVYCFLVCLELFPVSIAGFIATLLLNQSCWFRDDLPSGTPRSFVYPLFLAFLYYLLRRSWRGVWLVNTLQGLFYPPLIFISTLLLGVRLLQWRRGLPRLGQIDLKQMSFAAIAIGLGLLSLVPYAITSGQFAPVYTGAEARMMPEWWQNSRHPFFNPNPWQFWLFGQHSGIVPTLMPPLIWLGLLLPFLLRFPNRFHLIRQVQPTVNVLSQIVWVSLSLFAAAHLLLLKLFFPTRYTTHSLRVVMALAAGIAIAVLLDTALRIVEGSPLEKLLERSNRAEALAIRSKTARKQIGIGAAVAAVSLMLLFTPAFFNWFPKTNYLLVQDTSLYEFLQQQPVDSVVASLGEEADFIPTLAHRSVLVAREYALPFHRRYYEQIWQRTIDLLKAQYSQDIAPAQQLIRQYNVRFWLLNRNSFQSDYLKAGKRRWLSTYQPVYDGALASLQQGKPALQTLMRRCSTFRGKDAIVLSADCILKARSQSGT